MWFRHGNTSSKTDGSELNEDKLSEDLVKLEGVQSKDLKKDWLATILTVFSSFVVFWFLCKQGNYSFALLSLGVCLLL